MYEVVKTISFIFGITGITLDCLSVVMIFIVLATDSLFIERMSMYTLGIGMSLLGIGLLIFLIPFLIYVWK